MLVVETVAKIRRRAYFVQHKPIKQICRELKLSPRSSGGDPLGGNLPPLHPQRPACTQARPCATSSTDAGGQYGEAGAERLTLTRIFEALRGSATGRL